MLKPRWRKVYGDLWRNKLRSLLIILSIAVGTFAVGTVVHMNLIVSSDLERSYDAINPANASLYISERFDETLVQLARTLPGVAEAEGQQRAIVQFKRTGAETTYPIELVALGDYSANRVNKLAPETEVGEDWAGGVWPPDNSGLVLERTSLLTAQLGMIGARRGDTLRIQLADGTERPLLLSGLNYDFSQMPATFAGHAYGYVTQQIMAELGQPAGYSVLKIIVADHQGDMETIKHTVARLRLELEQHGKTVDRVELHEPGKLPLDSVFRAISLIMVMLGVLSLLLSVFLIINTISALLRQQVRQIGVMKACGARDEQIIAMYLVLVLILGLLGVAIAMPLALEAARWFIGFLSYFLNFKLSGFRVPIEVIAFELLMGVVVPALAALVPIMLGVRVTVRQAISSAGTSGGSTREQPPGWLLRTLRGLPRPLLMMMRNLTRQRIRLALTVLTLTLASSTFMAVLNLRLAMTRTVEQTFTLWNYDMALQITQPSSGALLANIATQMPGVARAEAWSETVGYALHEDGSSGPSIQLIALPAQTELLRPVLVQGSWLRPGDSKGIVIDLQVLKAYPELTPGRPLRLQLPQGSLNLEVIGVMRSVGTPLFGYLDHTAYDALVGQTGLANRVQVQLVDSGQQAQARETLTAAYRAQGHDVWQALLTNELRAQSETLFNIITSLLLTMAILMAIIGGLGLMGTLGLNILERRREIGVLRAIGASTGHILMIVIGEGLLMGLASWLIGALIAFPLGKVVSDAVGNEFFQMPLTYGISLSGLVIWLGLVTLLSVGASYFPAQQAAEMSVRAALSYE